MNLSRLMDIADVVRAAQTGAKVGRLVGENVVVGIARSVGNDTGAFARTNDDVETLYLRVTSLSGWEHFWPIAELATELRSGLFVPDYHG